MNPIRTVVLGLVTVCGVILAGPSAGAAPTGSGNVLEFGCGDAQIHVLLSPGGGNKSWSVDDLRVTDGTMFHVKNFEIRVYPGLLTAEPDDRDPAFVWSHAYGQRVGQGDTVVCEGSRPVNGTNTGFITVEVTTQDG